MKKYDIPMFDADALNAFEGWQASCRDGRSLVITPHRGNAADFMSIADIQANRIDVARKLFASMN